MVHPTIGSERMVRSAGQVYRSLTQPPSGGMILAVERPVYDE